MHMEEEDESSEPEFQIMLHNVPGKVDEATHAEEDYYYREPSNEVLRK